MPSFLWVGRGSPTQARNSRIGSARGRNEASKASLLDLPAEKNIKTVDYILDDLVEGVTLMVMSLPLQFEARLAITHMQSPIRVWWAVMEDK